MKISCTVLEECLSYRFPSALFPYFTDFTHLLYDVDGMRNMGKMWNGTYY